MHERPLVILTVGYLLGIFSVIIGIVWLLPIVLGMLLILIYNVRIEKRKAYAAFRLLLYCAGFVLGVCNYQREQVFRTAYDGRLSDGEKVIVQGELDEKEYKNEKYLYYLKNCYLVLSNNLVPCNRIIAETVEDVAVIGKILVVEGEVTAFHTARNEGNFDESSFYQSQKIDLKLKNITIQEQYGEEASFREALFALRQKLRGIYEVCMTRDTSGVLAQMVLAEKSLMGQEIKELYQKVGISHVLAISGLHISVIGMTLYKILRKVCVPEWLAGILAGGFMVSYGFMTGFRPSSARAIIMFLMMLTAKMVGRTYDSLSALALAAFLLLWENPYLLYYAGFLFSFAAVLGVVLVGTIIIKTFSEEEEHKVVKAFYTSFSIQLMTLPLTAYFYYEIPVYGMLVNLLILPLVSALLSFGIIGGVAGLVSLKVAGLLLLPCQWILYFYQSLSSVVQRLPYAALITGQPSIKRLAGYYVILFFLLYIISKTRKQHFFGAIGTGLLIYVLSVPQDTFKMAVLDVGQGDGIYLRTEAGQHLFFDGGSSDIYQVGTYRILPFLKANGVREIDYWFISHADKDHISGLQELLETGYPIEHLVFSEMVVQDNTYRTLLDMAKVNQTEVIWMAYQDVLHLGEASLTCLFPTRDFVSDDKNAASLVLYYEQEEFSGMFTGDIGAKEEQLLLDELEVFYYMEEDLPQVIARELDFYKVAHHGSKYSNSAVFLEFLKPKLSLVSCGINNQYGHPHDATLERLDKVKSNVMSTAEYGQITVEVEDGIITVEEYVKR